MPVVEGARPVSNAVREGLQSGEAQCAFENNAALREPVDVRRTDSRVASQAADPIVHVVHRQKQYVGPIVFTERSGGNRRTEKLPSGHATIIAPPLLARAALGR